MSTRNVAALGLLLLATSAGGALADIPRDQVERAIGSWRQEAEASFYCCWFHGRTAADGSRFDHMAPTAAHKTLPFGTLVRVVNPANSRAEVVRITDRGPFVRGRVIDLSLGTARRLGLERQGVARVWLEVLR